MLYRFRPHSPARVMVMSLCAGMGDAALRERLPALWRRIEDAHYSYLEIDDSPDKLQQKKKLEGEAEDSNTTQHNMLLWLVRILSNANNLRGELH